MESCDFSGRFARSREYVGNSGDCRAICLYEQTILDEHDFLRLFVEHERELAGFARALLPDWDAVDEVLQESSLVMWRKIGQLQAADEFMPWAKVIVRFEALKQIRRTRRDRHVLSVELVAMLADEAVEDDSSALRGEQAALRNCLQQFSPEHRELLMAPYAGDGKVKQLADAAGKSPNSLYKLLGRLRVKLHDCVLTRLAAEVS